MKKLLISIIIVLFVSYLFSASPPKGSNNPTTESYIVLAWNDLGMHCANKGFENMCILPPYNNHTAQVIKVGSPNTLPQVMGLSSGYSVSYEIPGNTYSVGKTNFWTYANQLFGVTLPNNIGLTGNGLSGYMADSSNYFIATGIPITPYADNNLITENPYQLTLIKAYNASHQLLASTQTVIPVSNEINCVSSGCHTSEMNILQKHEKVNGFNINNRPIFCATCHSDPALGMPGNGQAPPFSQVIHEKHGEFITTNCYKCHPGPNTQCFRDTMHAAGLTCVTCHGNVSQVGHSIDQGRTPWLQEPSCGATACHGPNYAENPGKLFRQSKGHGNLYCSACHNSPHAILPTSKPEDNLQNITLQGFKGTLKKCSVCHGYTPAGAGPHGLHGVPETKTLNLTALLEGLYSGGGRMNQAYNATGPQFGTGIADQITVELHNSSNYSVVEYTSGPVSLKTDGKVTVTAIPEIKNGSYNITIKHRNSIETTSAQPVSFSGATITYSFDAQSKAYDGNMTTTLEPDGETVSPPLIYAGDVNQDGVVDAEDINQVGNAAASFSTGYLPADVTGDGSVEAQDINVTGNNSAEFVYAHIPI